MNLVDFDRANGGAFLCLRALCDTAIHTTLHKTTREIMV
jgi:hypothetical protein